MRIDSKDAKKQSHYRAVFERTRKSISADFIIGKHFRATDGGGVLGLHAASRDGTSRWLAIDIDLHDDDDLSVTKEGNFVAAIAWWKKLREQGLDPILIDSNGKGGFHLFVFFARPMDSKSVRAFCELTVADFGKHGLDHPPDIFPGNFGPNHYGSWLRVPGRHHTRLHISKIWNDEPFDEQQWLEGHDCIDAIFSTRLADQQTLENVGIDRRILTVCLDFDGVVHSYDTGLAGVKR